jgi:hypothetical protein
MRFRYIDMQNVAIEYRHCIAMVAHMPGRYCYLQLASRIRSGTREAIRNILEHPLFERLYFLSHHHQHLPRSSPPQQRLASVLLLSGFDHTLTKRARSPGSPMLLGIGRSIGHQEGHRIARSAIRRWRPQIDRSELATACEFCRTATLLQVRRKQ